MLGLPHHQRVVPRTLPTKTSIPLALASQQVGPMSPTLPAYALDGRQLIWNADRTAVMFDSTNEEYHSDLGSISSTTLKALLRSPAHFRAYQCGPRKKQLDSQRIGTAAHAAVFEPNRFSRDFVVWDKRRGASGWKRFVADNAGHEILTRTEHDLVTACASAVRGTVAVQDNTGATYTVDDLITYGTCERNLYWVDQETTITCRMRADLMVQNCTLDLKTTDDAREDSFAWQCFRLGYDIQAAFYRRGRQAFSPDAGGYPFIFVAAELDSPHMALAHTADDEAFLEPGDRKVKAALAMLKACQASSSFPGYERPRTTLKLPFSVRYPRGLDI